VDEGEEEVKTGAGYVVKGCEGDVVDQILVGRGGKVLEEVGQLVEEGAA
jgi:hypothetical protein